MPAPWADAGSAPYNNITETDPMISDPENFDFRLRADSPAKGYGCETFYIPEGTKCKEEIIYSSKLTGGNISIGARIIENTIVKADTVNIYENIVIENNAALNILPGTVMLFHGPYNITVEGTLIAEGTAEERVIFTSFEPDPYNDFTSNKSSWRGIIFEKHFLQTTVRYSVTACSNTQNLSARQWTDRRIIRAELCFSITSQK